MIDLFQNAWSQVGAAQEFVLALVLSVLTAGILSLFRPRVKLHWGSTSLSFHKFKMLEDKEPVCITTEKLFVQNIGSRPAHDIELILSDIPTSYTLWAPREHASKPLKDGGFSISVPSLAPRELLIVDLIDVSLRNPKLIAVNCADVLAKNIEFQVQQKYGLLMYVVVFYLMAAGLVGTIFLGLKFAAS